MQKAYPYRRVDMHKFVCVVHFSSLFWMIFEQYFVAYKLERNESMYVHVLENFQELLH